MSAEEPNSPLSAAGSFWDRYVDEWEGAVDAEELEWPGDEWGTPTLWRRSFDGLFVPAGANEWQRAVEVGQGSGKYTMKVLESSQAAVRAYDVSPEFLRTCEERCRAMVESGRLSLHLLDSPDPGQILSELEDCGWRREVDCFYSMDAMVHVDLQVLIVYLITAAAALKPGGKLILTLADVTREAGFERLVSNINRNYLQDSPGRFKWLGPDVVRSVLDNAGFTVDVLGQAGLYMAVVASLARPERGDELARQLRLPR
jgi:SAM-dependent methyltransferase